MAPNHWRLQAQIPLVTFNLEPSRLLVLCWIFYCPVMKTSYEAQSSAWSASFRSQKEQNFTFMWQLHCAIYTIDLSSVHTRCPPELVSLLFVFLFFDCRWLQQKTLELQRPYPFSKLGFSPGRQSPSETVGENCKEEEAAVELCMQETVLKCDTGHTVMHTSSLHTTATPNRDWIHSGIGWFWVSGTIPNKRGFS